MDHQMWIGRMRGEDRRSGWAQRVNALRRSGFIRGHLDRRQLDMAERRLDALGQASCSGGQRAENYFELMLDLLPRFDAAMANPLYYCNNLPILRDKVADGAST